MVVAAAHETVMAETPDAATVPTWITDAADETPKFWTIAPAPLVGTQLTTAVAVPMFWR